jgi:hypothetical protein
MPDDNYKAPLNKILAILENKKKTNSNPPGAILECVARSIPNKYLKEYLVTQVMINEELALLVEVYNMGIQSVIDDLKKEYKDVLT